MSETVASRGHFGSKVAGGEFAPCQTSGLAHTHPGARLLKWGNAWGASRGELSHFTFDDNL